MPIEASLSALPWLLLPAAAMAGWYLARRSGAGTERGAGNNARSLAPDYFRGLNYLLNEQPDKAIEVFVNLLDVDSETVETHLALGNLFRRRGEVDRAIRIHQNLIARPSLTRDQRSEAVLELGMDYMRSGLLDRAESLFRELLDASPHQAAALRQLVLIYQQEQDWDKAIEFSRRLQEATGADQGTVIAHFECEKAELALEGGGLGQGRARVGRALAADPRCVRASLIEARIAASERRYEDAIRALQRIEDQDPEFLPEAFPHIVNCYEQAGRGEVELKQYLEGVSRRQAGITPVLLLADITAAEGRPEAALEYLRDELQKRPSVRGLNRFVQYGLPQVEGVALEHLKLVEQFTRQLQAGRATHRCNTCGFSGRALHWQCPGCKSWNTIKPIHGIAGE